MTIELRTNTLTDGSQTFDVMLSNTVLHAVTQGDALDLIEALRLAVLRHTLEDVNVRA